MTFYFWYDRNRILYRKISMDSTTGNYGSIRDTNIGHEYVRMTANTGST